MAWHTGKQKRKQKSNINSDIASIEGFLEENVAKEHLFKFLKENITFTTNLISGVDLFPFQHMAIKAMFETIISWECGLVVCRNLLLQAFMLF